MRFSPKNYSTASVLGTGGLLANTLLFHNPLLGATSLATGIFLWIALLERSFRGAKETACLRSFADAALFSLAAYTSISAMIYGLWKMDTTILCSLIAASGALQLFLLHKKTFTLPTDITIPRPTKRALCVGAVGILALVAAWDTLLGSGSTAALRSPWEMVPPRFFAFLGIATATLFILAQKKQTKQYSALLGVLIVTTSLFVAAVVYRLGYGFDPFIHEAAMREIAAHGAVLPKTPYYIGAYTLIVSLHRFSGIALHSLNMVIGPLLGTVALTDMGLTAAASLSWGAGIAIVLSVFAPLGHFIQTTPQGVADAFALLAIAAALRHTRTQTPWLLPYTLAAAATAAHPLAGIPALGTVALMHTWTTQQQKKRFFITVIVVTMLVAFPVIAFLVQSPIVAHLSASGLRLRLWDVLRAILHITTVETFSPWRTLLYSGRALFPLVFVGMSIFILLQRSTTAVQRALAIGAAATATGGLFLALFVRLSDVPTYEQLVFPLRFISLATLFVLPLFLEGATSVIQKVSRQKVGLFFFAGILALSIPAAIYLAYPRIDPEDRSGGRSVSSGTVDAVRMIHEEHPKNAIVLANQTAAAAEIWQYGFSRYVNGEFYYSHPSGAPHLYEYYLQTVNEGPSRDIMERAMAAYHADTIYFILHDYWKNSLTLRQQAITTADRVIDLSNEGVMIFVYTKK